MGWTGELMIASFGQNPLFPSLMSSCPSVRASLQDLLGPGRVSDLGLPLCPGRHVLHGMVLYELLSGTASALGPAPASDRQEAVQGHPPGSGSRRKCSLHRSKLMMECWDTAREGTWGPSQLLQLVEAVGLQSTPVRLPAHSSLRV